MPQNLDFCCYHPDQPISNICVANHTCIRKICQKCLTEHQVQSELLPTLEEFQNLLIQKSSEFTENNISSLTKFQSDFEAFFENNEKNFASIQKQMRESINISLGNVEQLNQTLLNYVTSRNSLFESSDILNCLISIIQGDSFVELNSLQNSYYLQANNYKNKLEKDLFSFFDNLKGQIETKLPKLGSIHLFLEVKEESDKQNKINSYNIKTDQTTQVETQILVIEDLIKIPIQISKQDNLEQIYVVDGEIIKIDPLDELAIESNDTSCNKYDINYLDQIQYLQWIGQYKTRNKKIGRWQAFFKGKKLQNVGGMYDKDGKKAGLWVEISSNFWQDSFIFEEGEYQNEKKKGQWSIIFETQHIGGGQYDEFEQKQGYWVELHEFSRGSQQIFNKGRYVNGRKTGKWVTTEKDRIIGEGYFDKGGQKVGLWVEYSNFSRNNKIQITQKGEYMNGVQVGFWSTLFNNKPIGGGYFDEDGLKFRNWKEQHGYINIDKQIIFDGYYMKGCKQGLWEATMTTLHRTTNKIGGGCYNQNGLKDGRWIDLHDRTQDHCCLIYDGYYNQGIKVGNWDILYKFEIKENLKKIGQGSYNDSGQKEGQWTDVCQKFHHLFQIIYKGLYMQGQKVGQWNIEFKEPKEHFYQKIGGGLYNEKGLKEGNWVSLHETFSCYNYIISEGMYKNGVRNGLWQQNAKSWGNVLEKLGRGNYDQIGQKQGKWTDIESKQITRNRQYLNGIIMFDNMS